MTALFVVDGHNLLYRAWFGFPARITSRDGTRDLTGVFGFLALVRKAHALCGQEHELVVVFDGEHATVARAGIDPRYKANRALADHTPIKSLRAVKQALDLAGVGWVELDEYEADDVIASLTHTAVHSGRPVTCYSGDRDFVQLLHHPGVTVLTPNRSTITAAEVTRRWAVAPRQWPDFRALTGDPADNIPGVPGIGPKTAAALLAGGAHLDQLPATDRLATRRCRSVVEMWPKVLAWRDLIRLDPTVPVSAGLVTGRPTPPLPLAARLVDQLGLW